MIKEPNIYRRGKIYWIRYSANGRQYRESTYSTNKSDAKLLLAKRLSEIAEGKEPASKVKNYTFEELAAAYSKWCERQRSFKTKQRLLKQLINAFGHLYTRQITTRLLEDFQTQRLKKGNKPATINRLMATMKHCMHKGYQWEMVTEDTLKRVRQVKLLEENNRRLRYLSPEECQHLIDACSGDIKAIVIIALNTGMRKSEILSLKWENVDLRHNFILLDNTKNGERREIPINETLRGVFQGLTRRLDVPYVFFDKTTGKPYQDVKKSFGSALRRAGIKDFRFHDLRHTFASHLVMAGVDITTVRELLGHKTLTMTLRYAHLAPTHKVKAVEVLDKAINTKKFGTVYARN